MCGTQCARRGLRSLKVHSYRRTKVMFVRRSAEEAGGTLPKSKV